MILLKYLVSLCEGNNHVHRFSAIFKKSSNHFQNFIVLSELCQITKLLHLWRNYIRLDSGFLEICYFSTLEVDTFKVMLLSSYLAQDFKSPLLDIEIVFYQ